MAMRDITELMNAYRECSRNLWNVYFSARENIGGSLDAFEQIRCLLFESLVVSEFFYEEDAEGEDIPPPALKVVPRERSLILHKEQNRHNHGDYPRPVVFHYCNRYSKSDNRGRAHPATRKRLFPCRAACAS